MTFLEQLTNVGIIARLNVDHTENCLATCQHLFAGGLRGILLNCTAPDHIATLSRLTAEAPDDALIGVSSISQPETIRIARDAGARFAASPHFDPELMATSIVEGLPLIAGAFTPTEIYQTWEAGATAVHLFPRTFLAPSS